MNKKKVVYAIIPLFVVACKQKPVDPAVQARIDSIAAKESAASDSLKATLDLTKSFAAKRDSLDAANRKMYADANAAAVARISAKYTLDKFFTPAQINSIKNAVKIRGRSSFNATQYDNVMAGRATLRDVIRIMSEISDQSKIARIEAAAKGIMGFDKDEDGYFAVFVDSKVHQSVIKQADEMKALFDEEFGAPELRKIEKRHQANKAQAARYDSLYTVYKELADKQAWRRDSLAYELERMGVRR